MTLSKETINLADLKRNGKLIIGNDETSLVDLGDKVCCLEMHSPGQVVTEAVIDFIPKALDEAEKNFIGMVIGSQEKCFCSGINLSPILNAIQDKDIDYLDNFVKKYQGAMMAIKYSRIPVVAAPYQQTLSSGMEIVLHCDRICAADTTYMGLTEMSVGLIPWGGGLKELLTRYTEGLRDDIIITNRLGYYQKAFDAVVRCKVTTSAGFYGKDKRQELGFLRKTDKVTDNQDDLLNHAKRNVLALDLEGYEPPKPKSTIMLGEEGVTQLSAFTYDKFVGNFMSNYDLKIADEVANVLCGGDITYNSPVSEQYLLDIERHAFLRLCREEKTQERISHLLNKGKALRN